MVQTYLGFYNLQIPHLNAAGGKVWDFELDTDWSFAFSSLRAAHAASEPTCHAAAMLVIALDARKPEFCAHEEFFTPTELFDLPDYGGLFRGVLYGTDVRSEAWGIGVFGNRHKDFNIVGCRAALELCACLSSILLDPGL